MRTGPERTALVPVVVLLAGVVPAAFSRGFLLVLLLVPVAAAVWVLRARVEAGPEGLTVCNGLRRQRVPWERVDAFDVPRRGPVRLRLTGGGQLPLTALPRRDLRRVLSVAPGASPDQAGTPATR